MQSQRITSIIMGVIVIVVGLVLETTILSQASTAGSNANIGVASKIPAKPRANPARPTIDACGRSDLSVCLRVCCSLQLVGTAHLRQQQCDA